VAKSPDYSDITQLLRSVAKSPRDDISQLFEVRNHSSRAWAIRMGYVGRCCDCDGCLIVPRWRPSLLRRRE